MQGDKITKDFWFYQKQRKTMQIKYFFLSIVLLGFCGCMTNNNNAKDNQVFRYNEYANISSLDPAYARNNATIWATNQLFNGLVQLDDSLNIKPDIAKKWHYNDSTHIYTFILRDDVFFHKHALFGKDSTRRVIAQDVTYSLNRLKDPKVASPGSWVLQQVDHFYAENDTIFKLKLKQPFPAFLGLLAMRYCSIVPEEIVTHYGNEFRSNPIGTGPFYFKLWEENVKLVFRKNHRYFETDDNGEALPYLEAVAVTFLPDKQSEFLQFVQGNIDFISGLDASYKDELLTSDGQLKNTYQETVNMIKSPYLNTEFIALQTQSDNIALQSPLIRKAINYGFDRKKMIAYLRNGIGIAATNGIIPKGMPGFDFIKGYDYQPEKARQLVEQYKAETGTQNVQLTLTTDSNYTDMYEYLQRELEKIGLSVSVDVVPSSSIRQARANGSLPAFRSSWIADYPDAQNYLSLFYSKNVTPNGPNYTFYKNELYDQWYKDSFTISDIEKRIGLYAKMDSLMITDAPIVPMYYDEVVRFVQKNVTGLGSNPQNNLVLKRVKKQPKN